MNWFALTVVALQVLAAADYAWKKQYSDSLIWLFYAAINAILIFKSMKS